MKGDRWNRWTPHDDRVIVRLRSEGQSYADIARTLGKTGGSVFRRLKKLEATSTAGADWAGQTRGLSGDKGDGGRERHRSR